MKMQYQLGRLAGRWAEARKRLSIQYLRGYAAGLLSRWTQ